MKFRPYQVRIIKAQDGFMADMSVLRATVLCATGGGKTYCFTDLIKKMFSTNKMKILIAHPRIALSMNQQKRLKADLVGFGATFTSFHSGKVHHTRLDRKNQSTTSRDELIEIQNECAGPHITFSSYKSLAKIADMDFDLIICDEAHYLVQSDLRNSLKLFKSKVLFYTGTPIQVAAQEESMDNVDLFGPVIANVPPKEIIPFGYIVPPVVRYLDVKIKKKGNTIDYPTTIAYAYKDQVSKAHKKFNHKMLVAMPSTIKFDDIMGELATIRLIVGDFDLDIYYITAGRSVKNGIEMGDREVALEDFDATLNRAIIIHCDTLAEGIDIDGIGGIFLLRNMGKAKTIQTIGRGCRAAAQDKLASGNIRKNRVKTQCIVTLARVGGEWCSGLKTSEYAEIFKSGGYGDLMDLIDPELRGAAGEYVPGEPITTVWDEVQEVRVADNTNQLYSELFSEVM